MNETLFREVEVPCSPSEAWRHVTDPSWLGDHGEIDLTPGGEGWLDVDGDQQFLVVEEVEEDRRFAYRWSSVREEPSHVEIDLAPTDAGTRITITESPVNAKALAGVLVP